MMASAREFCSWRRMCRLCSIVAATATAIRPMASTRSMITQR